MTAWIDRYRLDAERNYRRLDALLSRMTDKTERS
ncbi:putative transcriptional regulator [Mycolicibacterium phlei]|nr:hypothetical protein MPHLCCUG_02974 [Mycolicibacterium phlei]STZ19158.1 putative transcriptional regulator [Mycolicibacterium phlei]VEG09890.1 putative transcriptional regulator [Mycobacteroides chelonae]